MSSKPPDLSLVVFHLRQQNARQSRQRKRHGFIPCFHHRRKKTEPRILKICIKAAADWPYIPASKCSVLYRFPVSPPCWRKPSSSLRVVRSHRVKGHEIPFSQGLAHLDQLGFRLVKGETGRGFSWLLARLYRRIRYFLSLIIRHDTSP